MDLLYNHVYYFSSQKLIDFGKTGCHYNIERPSKGEQNDTNFSSVAPSSEELRVFTYIYYCDDLYHARDI